MVSILLNAAGSCSDHGLKNKRLVYYIMPYNISVQETDRYLSYYKT